MTHKTKRHAYNALSANSDHDMSWNYDDNGEAGASSIYCMDCSSSAPPPMLSPLHATNPQEAEENFTTMQHLNPTPLSLEDNSDHAPDSTQQTIVRTRLHIASGLCCSSEIPAIKSLLKPLKISGGIQKIGVNVATKVVWIDHDPTMVTAEEMKAVLTGGKFGVDILKDGHSSINLDGADNSTCSHATRSNYVESTFLIKGIVDPSSHHHSTHRYVNGSMVKLIRQHFTKDQIRVIQVHVPSQTMKVEHDPSVCDVNHIKEAIDRHWKTMMPRGGEQESRCWGEIQLLRDGAAEGLNLPMLDNGKQIEGTPEEKDGMFAGLKFNVVISGIFWITSLFSVIDPIRLDKLKYAGIISVLTGMPPVLVKACMTIRRCQFDANCMMVIAAFGALALGEYDEAASVSFLFSISEWLENQATGKARRALSEIVALRPEYAHVMDGEGGVRIMPAEAVPLGSLCSVRTGDKVPADGVVVEGTSSVDESSITGEARPVDVKAGDAVSAGAINVGSNQLVIKTSSTVGDSTLSRLIALVEEAQVNRSETEKLVDSFAKKYTPFVLATAVLVCTVPWVFGVETGRHWTLNGLIIIVIACPCALTISTPVTYSAGLAATAKRGIIIKGGSRLEALGSVKKVIFDKTGTLTQGRFALNHLELIGERASRREVLELLSIMETPSSHPLSAALVAAAQAEGIHPPQGMLLKDHMNLKGEGVCATVNGQKVYVGNRRLFKRLDMMYDLSPQHKENARKWNVEGGTVGYIGTEGLGIIAIYCVTDRVREEAQHVVTSLIGSGLEVVMLTGDGEGAAHAIGEEIGLPNSSIQSQLLPEDKLHYVSAVKDTSSRSAGLCRSKRKLVMFVGDGINDAPALAVADVGVAMGQGAALALEIGDICLMDSDLNKLLFGMKMGSKVITTVKENIVFSLFANATAVGLTFAGKMTLLLAIVCDVGVMLLVTLNGMKLLSERVIRGMEEGSTKVPLMDSVALLAEKSQMQYEMQSTESGGMEMV